MDGGSCSMQLFRELGFFYQVALPTGSRSPLLHILYLFCRKRREEVWRFTWAFPIVALNVVYVIFIGKHSITWFQLQKGLENVICVLRMKTEIIYWPVCQTLLCTFSFTYYLNYTNEIGVAISFSAQGVHNRQKDV